MSERRSGSITTKTGDRGQTRLFSGELVSKHSARPAACGEVDEVVSLLGVARCHVTTPAIRATLLDLQRLLFVVASELATTPRVLGALSRRMDAAMVGELDRRCAEAEASLPPFNGFVIPGERPGAAYLDLARSVARRCERHVVALARRGLVRNRHLLVWMNRLSDFLWLLARQEEQGHTRPLREAP